MSCARRILRGHGKPEWRRLVYLDRQLLFAANQIQFVHLRSVYTNDISDPGV